MPAGPVGRLPLRAREGHLQPGCNSRRIKAINPPKSKEPITRSRRFSSYGLMPAAYTVLMFLVALLLGTLLYKCAGNVPYAPGR